MLASTAHSRPLVSYLSGRRLDERDMLPQQLARRQVEGGAPYTRPTWAWEGGHIFPRTSLFDTALTPNGKTKVCELDVALPHVV